MNRLAEADQPVSAPARRQSRRLVAVDTRGLRGGEAAQRPDPPVHRLRRLPLVPRHGARKLFSDPAIAALLNRDFVCIKVDREERPEVDQIYMRALHALGEQGGWPLTMFLTPDAEPFWGGTYFPPEPRWGRPSFPQILSAVSAAWQAQDAAVTQNASALREHLNRRPARSRSAPASRHPRPGRRTRSCPSGIRSAAASRARRNSPMRPCSTCSGALTCAPATQASARPFSTR